MHNHVLEASLLLVQGLLLLCNAEFMARYPGASKQNSRAAASGLMWPPELPGRTASIAIYVAAEDWVGNKLCAAFVLYLGAGAACLCKA